MDHFAYSCSADGRNASFGTDIYAKLDERRIVIDPVLDFEVSRILFVLLEHKYHGLRVLTASAFAIAFVHLL